MGVWQDCLILSDSPGKGVVLMAETFRDPGTLWNTISKENPVRPVQLSAWDLWSSPICPLKDAYAQLGEYRKERDVLKRLMTGRTNESPGKQKAEVERFGDKGKPYVLNQQKICTMLLTH